MHLQKCIAKIHSLHIHINTFLLCKLQVKKPQAGCVPLFGGRKTAKCLNNTSGVYDKTNECVGFFFGVFSSDAKHHHL